MVKQKSSDPSSASEGTQGTFFEEVRLQDVDPKQEQFEPTPEDPIRQRARMGGVS